MSQANIRSLKPLHLLLTVQTVVVILLSINRLSSLTVGYVAANEFLRWVDLNNMLFIPLISLVAFYILKKWLEYAIPAREGNWHRAVGVLFLVGVYLTGASYGDHEVTNYLHVRYCLDTAVDQVATQGEYAGSTLCRILIFNDDEFSHWLFFSGFVMTNLAMLLVQTIFPHGKKLTAVDLTLLLVNGLFIGLGVFANLAFEVIGLDLYVVALLALLSLVLLWRYGKQPLLLYYTTAYLFGLIATALYKALN